MIEYNDTNDTFYTSVLVFRFQLSSTYSMTFWHYYHFQKLSLLLLLHTLTCFIFLAPFFSFPLLQTTPILSPQAVWWLLIIIKDILQTFLMTNVCKIWSFNKILKCLPRTLHLKTSESRTWPVQTVFDGWFNPLITDRFQLMTVLRPLHFFFVWLICFCNCADYLVFSIYKYPVHTLCVYLYILL